MRILRTTLGAAMALLVVSHAHADQPATTPPTSQSQAGAPSAPPGGATSPTIPKLGSAGISEEARRHFAAGVSLLQDPEGAQVEEAYREFRAAYEISDSAKILGNMGFCAMRLERDGEAIEAYSRYLRDVPDIDPDERAQIVRDLQTLTVGVVRLAIEVDKPGVRLIDVRTPVRGERVTNTYGPVTTGKVELGVRPGHHIITAKLPDHEDAMWEVDVFAGSRDRYGFTMRPRAVASPSGPSQNGGGASTGPWIVMAIGGAMLVGSAVTGIVALGKTHDIESRCPGDVCPRAFDLEGERSSAKTFVRITDVLLIGGGAVTLGGLGWLLLGNRKSEGEREPGKPAASSAHAKGALALPSLGCGPDGCRASMKVVF